MDDPSSSSSISKNASNDDDDDVVVLTNRRIVLVRRPDGLPRPEDFRSEVTTLEVPAIDFRPRPQREERGDDDEKRRTTTTITIVLATRFVSIDPAMRGWMSSARSYLPPVAIGAVMRATSVCEIVAVSSSSILEGDDDFPIGSVVRTDSVGVQEIGILRDLTPSKARRLLTRIEPVRLGGSSPSSSSSSSLTSSSSYAPHLGILGTTGMTAYFGLLKVGKPSKGDVVLVSGAAGSTGSIVAQIAKNVVGCSKVIGIAGTDEKCRNLLRNGSVDAAINYRNCSGSGSSSLAKAIRREAPDGADVVFDNVGGDFLEAALGNLSRNGGARVVLCGAISRYNHRNNNGDGPVPSGPRNYMNLLVRRAAMEGFVVFDHREEYPRAVRDLSRWIREGKIHRASADVDDRHVGIDGFYPALMSLFDGTNDSGKVVLPVNIGIGVGVRDRDHHRSRL